MLRMGARAELSLGSACKVTKKVLALEKSARASKAPVPSKGPTLAPHLTSQPISSKSVTSQLAEEKADAEETLLQ